MPAKGKPLNYSFKPSLWSVLLLALVFPLLLALGTWQLHRADEKTALMALREARMREPPIQLEASTPDSIEDLRYRSVVVEGEYDVAHQFLIDNQMLGQQVGYHVLTPFRLAGSGQSVLVNRGWAPWGSARNVLPDISQAPKGKISIAGVLDRLHRVGFRLQGAEIPAAGWPSVVQLPEPNPLSRRLGYSLLSYQVLLSPQVEGGYARDWHASKLDPDKNRGYALQWFLFAAIALMIFFWRGLHRQPR